MQLNQLTIKSFQGIDHLELETTAPIVLISGGNATGKTTIRDAIRMALTGQSGRVVHKKDYNQMVRDGASSKDSSVAVLFDGFEWARDVVGDTSELPDTPKVLPYLLGFDLFATLDRKTQTGILFNITGTRMTPAILTGMMNDLGIDPTCVSELTPLMRVGFDAMQRECKNKLSECRGAWKAVTGETFGIQKAEKWEPEMPEGMDIKELKANTVAALDAVEEGLKLVSEARDNLDAIKQHTHTSGVTYTCPCCNEDLVIMAGELVKDERGEEEEPNMDEQAALQKAVWDAEESLAQAQSYYDRSSNDLTVAENAEEVLNKAKAKAAYYLQLFKNWTEAEKAVAPEGIQLRVITKVLKKVNKHLEKTSKAAGWKDIIVHKDMSITYGDIGYNLCSESERWRIDAAISEMIALLSNVKFFVLDRMDVLAPKDRIGALKWLLSICDQHDTILVMATMKQKPAGLPSDKVQAIWLDEGGVIS